jgi:putative intracellular protease/amidase
MMKMITIIMTVAMITTIVIAVGIMTTGCATVSSRSTDETGNTLTLKGKAVGKAGINKLEQIGSMSVNKDGTWKTNVGTKGSGIESDNDLAELLSAALTALEKAIQLYIPSPADILYAPGGDTTALYVLPNKDL